MKSVKLSLAVVGLVALAAGCAQQGPAGFDTAAPTPTSARSTPTVPSGDGKNTPRATQSVAPTVSETPTPQNLLQTGSIGMQVRELQARLRQLQLFSGYDVTDTYGPMTTQAVSAFQKGKKLTATGNVDQATWDALTKETDAPSQAELNNQIPGPAVVGASSSADDIKDLQFRLAQVVSYADGTSGQWNENLTQAVKDLQTKQVIPVTGEVDQRTYDRLANATRGATPWELNGSPQPVASDGVAQVLDPRCMKGRVLCSSMDQRKISWVIDGKILATMDARYGRESDPTYPGVFQVYYKDPNLISRMYGDVPMPFSMCFDQSRCVHYAEDFNTLGWTVGSHGCVNVRDWDTLKWIYSQVNLGDTVVIYP